MTRDNDFERVLDQWLAEGPTQMPGRFLDDTLDLIDHAPKRPLAWLRPRAIDTNRKRLIAAAAAIVLLVAGIGSVVVLRTPGVGTSPTPSPSPGAFADPPLLVGSWTSVGTRHRPFQNGDHVNDTIGRVDIVVGDADVSWDDLKAAVLSSRSPVGPDTFEVRIVSGPPPEWNCRIGDVGTYRSSLSADGLNLTLTPLGDACAVRQAVLAGDWLRTDMGTLAPGRHVSRLFRPFGEAGGPLSYAVPAGWGDGWECPQCLNLVKTDVAATTTTSIDMYANIKPTSLGAPCNTAIAGAGTTPTGIAQWLTTLPGLVVTTPSPVTIGGLAGISVDVSVVPNGDTGACPFLIDGSGSITLADPDVPDLNLSIPSAGQARWILLDRGTAPTLLVALATENKASWDAYLAETMPIVDSFTFVP